MIHFENVISNIIMYRVKMHNSMSLQEATWTPLKFRVGVGDGGGGAGLCCKQNFRIVLVHVCLKWFKRPGQCYNVGSYALITSKMPEGGWIHIYVVIIKCHSEWSFIVILTIQVKYSKSCLSLPTHFLPDTWWPSIITMLLLWTCLQALKLYNKDILDDKIMVITYILFL